MRPFCQTRRYSGPLRSAWLRACIRLLSLVLLVQVSGMIQLVADAFGSPENGCTERCSDHDQSIPCSPLCPTGTCVHHEKLEEDYVFPRFRRAGKLTDLVNT